MSLKCYFDLLSQPSRAVFMFLKTNNIPFEAKPVALRKGEHFTDEYAKINPFKLVPVIDHDGFKLTESVAILKYLASGFSVPDHWYPRADLKTQARVDEYANWQHLNIRGNAALIFQHLLILPRMRNQPPNMKQVEKYRSQLETSVENLESYYLKSHPYLCGNEITIADLLGVCELLQLYGVHEENLFESNPTVKAWIERVKQKLGPVFDEAHKMVYRVREVTQPAAKL